jgi:hypothetical protein
MSMTPHKRKAQEENNEDDVAAEGQQRAQSVAARAPSNPPPAALTATAIPSSLTSSEALPPHVAPAGLSTAVASSSSAAFSPSTVACALPLPHAAGAASSAAAAAPVDVQAPPVASAPFGRLADVEVQMIMQLLDQQSLLRLARCSRSLFCCASHPFGWQRLRFRVDVRGSDVIEDPRRAGSLLRFESSIAFVDQHANDPSSLVSCATLLRVPRLIALNFERSSQPLMQQSEWHSFLQHPSARRLERLNLWLQPTLCDAAGLSLLSQLPLLNALLLRLPAAAPALHLAPLANCPCLTDVRLCGPMEAFPAPLEPLAGCIRLRSLTLHGLALRVGQLSALFMRLAQAGSQLRELRLFHLRMLPMNDSVLDVAPEPADSTLDLELTLAASSLTHLRKLVLCSTSSALDCVLCLPSLR